MNKEGLIEEKKIAIKMTNENGIAIRKDDISLSTGKIVINGVEITDTESWYKALKSFNILQRKLEKIKFYIEQSDIKNMLWGKEILEIIEREEK